MRHDGVRLSGMRAKAAVVQLLLGFWMAMGMHIVHPLFHRDHCGHSGDSASAGLTFCCCHFDGGRSFSENGEQDSFADEGQIEVLRTGGGDLAAHTVFDEFDGACPVCGFMMVFGKWTVPVADAVCTVSHLSESAPVRKIFPFPSLHFSCGLARAPPVLFSLPS